MKSVLIFTNFGQYFKAYSLTIIVERQIKMLCENGYKPKVTVMDGFKPEGEFAREDIELCYLPKVGCHNEWGRDKPEPFNKEVGEIKEKLREYLNGIDVVITHDLTFQASTEKFDAAARQLIKDFPDIRWLHWVHSCAVDGKKREKFPNSFVVYPNAYDIPRVARAFGYEENEIKVVPHPIDVCSFFNMNPLSEMIIKKFDILMADVIMTYPLRLDRGKQPEMCVKLIKQVKKMGKSVRLIFMDFHSTGGDKAKYREELKVMAAEGGLSSSEVIFVSEQDPSLKLEAPRDMVKDFMEISNVFLLPSRSETFSLVAQEAMITGNFPILNFDFMPMRSIYGDKPLYRKFSSAIDIKDGMNGTTETTYGKEDNYFMDIAGYINFELEHDRIMALRTQMRRDHNLKAVFKKYLEPLIYYAGK